MSSFFIQNKRFDSESPDDLTTITYSDGSSVTVDITGEIDRSKLVSDGIITSKFCVSRVLMDDVTP